MTPRRVTLKVSPQTAFALGEMRAWLVWAKGRNVTIDGQVAYLLATWHMYDPEGREFVKAKGPPRVRVTDAPA